MVTIKISNRAMYSLIAVILIIAVVGIAAGFVNPSTGVGHETNEIRGGVCNKNNQGDCPVLATGEDIYIEPAGTYINGDCQPTCNAEIINITHGDTPSNCTDYTYLGQYSSEYQCTNPRGNAGVICSSVPVGIDTEYICAKKHENVELQFIGERFYSN